MHGFHPFLLSSVPALLVIEPALNTCLAAFPLFSTTIMLCFIVSRIPKEEAMLAGQFKAKWTKHCKEVQYRLVPFVW